MVANHSIQDSPTKIVNITPEMIASRSTAAGRRSSKNIALRALHRERLKKETGSLMHPRQNPKSDHLCCVKSEGLCRNIGAKHHRRNKQCWNFPDLCLHCKEAKADPRPESPGVKRVPIKSEPVLEAQSPQQTIKPKLLNQLINERCVGANSKSVTIKRSQSASTISPYLPGANPNLNIGLVLPELGTTSVGSRHLKEPYPSNMVYTIEFDDDEPSDRETFELSTPDLKTINDLEKRRVRSHAPSPECANRRAMREIQVDTLDFRGYKVTRDPRLDLKFVLETKTLA